MLVFTSSLLQFTFSCHGVDVGIGMDVVTLSNIVVNVFVRWHNKYGRLTVFELFVFLISAIS